MIIRCPSCRRPTYVDEALMGHLARCEHCRVFMKLRPVSCPVNEMTPAEGTARVLSPVATLGPAQVQHPAALRRQFVRDVRPAWRTRQRGVARTRLFTMFAVGVAFTLMGLGIITLLMNFEQMTPGPRTAHAAAGPGVGR